MCRIYAIVLCESRQILDSFRGIGNELTVHSFSLIVVNGILQFHTILPPPCFGIYFSALIVVILYK